MEIRNIKTFIRAAETGNFTKTAEELGYSQGTVTLQIKQLEAELGNCHETTLPFGLIM